MHWARFEWDEDKDKDNQQKHGLPFEIAQYAFADPDRVIAEDLGHGGGEKRYFCFGKGPRGIMTVRFTYRESVTGFSEQDIGEREEKYMKKKTKSAHESIGAYRVIKDFLPSPEHLAFKAEKVKITIALSKASVEFFKRESKKHHTQYQTMIRRLLDYYTTQQQSG